MDNTRMHQQRIVFEEGFNGNDIPVVFQIDPDEIMMLLASSSSSTHPTSSPTLGPLSSSSSSAIAAAAAASSRSQLSQQQQRSTRHQHSESASLFLPKLLPVYALVSRYSYLPIHAIGAIRYFQHIILSRNASSENNNNNMNNYQSSYQLNESISGDNSIFDKEIWFESNGIPLKYQIPCGILHDITSLNQYPWKITVRFTQFPQNMLLPLTSDDIPRSCQTQFYHALKQALHLRFGGNPFTDLTKIEQDDLWDGVITKNFNVFWTPLSKMLYPSQGHSIKSRHPPVRLFFRQGNQLEQGDDRCTFVQPFVEDIQSTLRDILTSQACNDYIKPEQLDSFIAAESSDTIKIIVNGTQLPSSIVSNAPIIDLCDWLGMQDQFLYVVIHY